MILVKRDIECDSIPIVKTLSAEVDCEISGIIIKRSNMIILTVYRSPLGDFNVFIRTLTILFSKLNVSKNVIVLCGDLNVKFHTSDNQAVYLTDLLNSFELYPVIYETPETKVVSIISL
ncbi:hypothetical protein PPYR_11092 [Photinus pyralis]|uniref:Endonuclease/exonuclease/phosphatase domain-containing protein n=1 Tax=Photinus pyralis TaxID=7054 RepID=A0A5N4AI89_PHOPY|nr:hypothetical protein PPYR_11092 [Photinus pyralis]